MLVSVESTIYDVSCFQNRRHLPGRCVQEVILGVPQKTLRGVQKKTFLLLHAVVPSVCYVVLLQQLF